MKRMARLYHLLGSLSFAIFLIATTAGFVIAGTILESMTDSHLYASRFTYGNPLFALLLIGYFVNILFSALRRWPFKGRHVPFLTTHLGLLLIISGTFIKSLWGVQGVMGITEGCGSQHVMEVGSLALEVESPTEKKQYRLLKNPFKGYYSTVKDQRPWWNRWFTQNPHLSSPKITLLDIQPHCREDLHLFFKGNYAQVTGLPPFPVHEYFLDPGEEAVPASMRAPPFAFNPQEFLFYAVKSPHITKLVRRLYRDKTRLRIIDPLTDQVYVDLSLDEALEWPVNTPLGPLHLTLEMAYSPEEGNLQAHLEGVLENQSTAEKPFLTVPLIGPEALMVSHEKGFLGGLPFAIEINRPPAILLIQEPTGHEVAITLSAEGSITAERFNPESLSSLIVLDHGYGGYAGASTIPNILLPHGSVQKERAQLHHLAMQLRNDADEKHNLALPLAFLKNACEEAGEDFVEVLLTFLYEWYHTYRWLFPLEKTLPLSLENALIHLQWKDLPAELRKGTFWATELLTVVEQGLLKGQNLLDILDEAQWPLVDELREYREDPTTLLPYLTRLLLQVSEQLPEPADDLVRHPNAKARLLSVWFRAYNLHFNTIAPEPKDLNIAQFEASGMLDREVRQIVELSPTATTAQVAHAIAKADPHTLKASIIAHLLKDLAPALDYEWTSDPTIEQLADAYRKYAPVLPPAGDTYDLATVNQGNTLNLECPITVTHTNEKSGSKIEDNRPKITLRIEEGAQQEIVTLAYDPFATGLKWPVLGGNYLLRFQPWQRAIPHRIRLREARQINYPGTQQAFSYESDLLVTEKDQEIAKTISMNNVLETDDGYRFYMANLFPTDVGIVRQAQIVVNRDPVRYRLTYPGAVIMGLGIFLLFWLRPYSPR